MWHHSTGSRDAGFFIVGVSRAGPPGQFDQVAIYSGTLPNIAPLVKFEFFLGLPEAMDIDWSLTTLAV